MMIQKAMLALCLLFGSQLAMAQPDKYREGVHYFKLDQVPARAATGEVEVTELFSYLCSHCNTFEPYMQNWIEKQPEHVKFGRIAVSFGRAAWEMMARGYITAEMMGIIDKSHVAMMDAIWKNGRQFRSVEELADFYSGFGVEKSAFVANYQSFAADSQLRRSQRDVKLFGITGTPSIVVNRQYRVVGNKDVPDYDAILDVVDFLVAKEHAAP